MPSVADAGSLGVKWGAMCCSCRWGFSGSTEWLVLLFLLWPSQSISLSGRRTDVLEGGCLRLPELGFRMPVELVRGGMALGEAKGWTEDEAGMVRGRPQAGRKVASCMAGALSHGTMTAATAQTEGYSFD
jgi:hypothetical protein